MMRQEPGLHHLIRAATTIPVAEVIGHDFSRTLIDRDYLVMAALPGIPLSDAEFQTARQAWRENEAPLHKAHCFRHHRAQFLKELEADREKLAQ
jgi:aminoglycoside phosphotransferase